MVGGLENAINERTKNFQDLVWQRSGDRFELAIELKIPGELLKGGPYNIVRYEVAIGFERKDNEAAILEERVSIKADAPPFEKHDMGQLHIFPRQHMEPPTLISPTKLKSTKTIINKVRGGNDNFYSEIYPAKSKGWAPSFRLGPRRSALGNLPADETKFPVSTWLKELLTEGVQKIVLNSLLMRRASPPGQGRGFKPDGSNLPWVIHNFNTAAPENFKEWIAHLQTALPDIVDISTIERSDDKHRYLIIHYAGGLEIPSWMASDGTLRLLALTLPAYLPDFTGVYLIEEPENGIHPRAVETVFQSLSSVYAAQILLATHSPIILSVAQPAEVLCFAKTENGAADIVSGTKHPALRDWKGETNLGVLFAGGVLG